MATVTLEITDEGENGAARVRLEADPPIKSEDDLTTAQSLAIIALAAMNEAIEDTGGDVKIFSALLANGEATVPGEGDGEAN